MIYAYLINFNDGLSTQLSTYHMAARHSCKDNQETNFGTQATLDPFESTNLFLLTNLSTTFLPKLAGLRKVYVTPFDVDLKVWAMSLNAFLKLFETVACGLVVDIKVLTCL